MNNIELTLGIISFISFLIAFPQIFGSNWKEFSELIFQGKVSWNEIQKASNKIAKELRKEGVTPTCILGIGRGGALATGLLSSEFVKNIIIKDSGEVEKIINNNLRIGVINTKIYLKKDKIKDEIANQVISRIDKIEYSDVDLKLNKSDKILIVTAQSYRGESFQKIINKLVSLGIDRGNIISATLFWHRHRQIEVLHEPDLYGKILSINKTMPWKDAKHNTNRY